MNFWETQEGFDTGRLMINRLMEDKKHHCKLFFSEDGDMRTSAKKMEKEMEEIFSNGGKYVSHIKADKRHPADLRDGGVVRKDSMELHTVFFCDQSTFPFCCSTQKYFIPIEDFFCPIKAK